MQKDKDTFVGYGKPFQESVARLMMEDRPFCDQIEEVLELEFFDSAYLRAFVEIILDYREKYNQHPHFATLHTEIKKGSKKYDGAVNKQLSLQYKNLNQSGKRLTFKDFWWPTARSL